MKKTIDDFTKEELFNFYSEIRDSGTYIIDDYKGIVYNEGLLDDIENMVKDMEKPK